MRKLILALMMGLLAVVGSSDAQAYHGGGHLGFIPFGYYQPYGVRYSTSVRTPPYFALNPPVYYGTRYHRPYGVSPFAAPPQVSVPASYQAQPAPQQAPRPQRIGAVVCNPFVVQAEATPTVDEGVAVTPQAESNHDSLPQRLAPPSADGETAVLGPVRTNPYVVGDNFAAL